MFRRQESQIFNDDINILNDLQERENKTYNELIEYEQNILKQIEEENVFEEIPESNDYFGNYLDKFIRRSISDYVKR